MSVSPHRHGNSIIALERPCAISYTVASERELQRLSELPSHRAMYALLSNLRPVLAADMYRTVP
jgi:hypothetical protein